MIETNIRLLEPGPGLCMDVRAARVKASDASPDLPWKACGVLQGMGLAAVRRPGTSELIVATSRAVPSFDRSGNNWRYEVEDSGQSTRLLRYERPSDRDLLAQLAERLLLMQVQRRTDLWRLGDSRTIWYESEPFDIKDGVAAYRRYEISGLSLGDAGVGFSVNIGTAFFTTKTVAEFFGDDLSPSEQERNKRRFDSLSARQQGQKGTLLYEAGETLHTCYFDDFRHGTTCASTGAFRVQGQDYDSLLDYYRRRHPEMEVKSDDPVAYVSFRNIDRPRPVAANRLRLRVSNESLPARLKQVDKIPPEDRRSYVEGFWERLGEEPLGPKKPQVVANFWRPRSDRLLRIRPPELTFGGNKSLPAPLDGSLKERKDHFRERSRLLERAGCFETPLMVTRVVHVAVPKKIGEATGERLAKDLADRLSSWTRKPVRCDLVLYEDTNDAVSRLRAEPNAGVVVFVMDDDVPEIYYDIAYELKGWRVKRITGDTLVGMFSKLELDAHDGRASRNGKNGRVPSPRRWDSFVEKNALEVLQHMDCVPYVPAEGFNYEAQLAIDVGHDRRYFSLSLLVRRQDPLRPRFRLETVAKSKPDHKQEAINDVMLREEIVALFERLSMSGHAPLRSVLILRDGRVCGRELEGINAAREILADSGLLEDGARVDVVDFHKSSAMRIRVWDKDRKGQARHAFEGTAILLDERTAVLTNTGAATLRQGTAEPVVLIAKGDGVDLRAVLEDVHVAAHLNWSNPDVAQWLPLSLKRTDEELKNRAAQEIRRVSTR